jgi:hypothetical protein
MTPMVGQCHRDVRQPGAVDALARKDDDRARARSNQPKRGTESNPAGGGVMVQWKIATALGVAFGVAGIGWGYAQQQQAPGFYELRVYTAQPGKRDALARRFADRTAAIFARHGITNVGYWIPQQSDPELGITAENTFIYIRGYPSKEERDKRLKARGEDPEFKDVVQKAEGNPETKLIVKVHNIDMVPHGPYTAISLTK